MFSVRVDLGERGYDILIEPASLCRAGPAIADSCRSRTIAIVTDTAVAPLYLEPVAASLRNAGFTVHTLSLPSGEQHKTLTTISGIYNALCGFGLDRTSLLAALGGGVIGDMTGFAAATYLRGIPFVQIPTTLLAQVDSSIGGKTGVNLSQGKNLVGAFYQPIRVLIDPDVLRSLPEREFRSGLAEVVKYGVIRHPPLFDHIAAHLDDVFALETDILAFIIGKCCEIKAAITGRDETEQGIRAILNFGHTIGHAVETLTGYKTHTHGEAVAVGMAAAARLSRRWNLCSLDTCERIDRLLQAAGLPVALPPFTPEEYLSVIMHDKKKSGDEPRMVLLREIGSVTVETVPGGRILEALGNLLQQN